MTSWQALTFAYTAACIFLAAIVRGYSGFGFSLLAITSTAARDLHKALLGRDGVMSVMLVGDGVHAVVDDADRRVPELSAALDAGKIPHGELVRVTPSIEDLFVGLLKDEHAS